MSARPGAERAQPSRLLSIVIPARNEARAIPGVIGAIQAQRSPSLDLEIIVVDDGSTDGTPDAARRAGARVLELGSDGNGGNPAAARNRGAAIATGDPIVFLDADCTPRPGWLERLVAAHEQGAGMVGGSLDLPGGLSPSARCDYYCGWYHVHPRGRRGPVPNHPPGNLSVRREVFLRTRGFTERQPIAYAHEELAWQAEARRAGEEIFFEPGAVVYHHNRPGFGNLLRRNYRWGYSAIESKAGTGTARLGWVYDHPVLLIAGSLPLALGTAAYIIGCWLKAGRLEPLLMFPAVLLARLAYSAGLAAGGLHWLRHGTTRDRRPRWE